MPTNFSLNIVKIFAFAAVVALVMSFGGRQAGFITYGLLNPPDDPPKYEDHIQGYKYRPVTPPAEPAVAEPEKTPPVVVNKTTPVVDTTPVVVKKSVPAKGPASPVKPVPLIQTTPNKSPKPGIKPKDQPAPLSNIIELNAAGSRRPVIDTSGIYAIQTGVFTARKNAEENVQRFRLKGYSPATAVLTCGNGSKVYAIRIGCFSDKTEAKTALSNFKESWNKDALLVPLYSKQDLMSFCKEK